MLPKQLFCKKEKIIFSLFWWHNSRVLHPEGLLWAPAAAQNHQMSSMRWLKVVRSCYQNDYFTKMKKQFFRYHDGIFSACSILKGCCGRLRLHKTAKKAWWDSKVKVILIKKVNFGTFIFIFIFHFNFLSFSFFSFLELSFFFE